MNRRPITEGATACMYVLLGWLVTMMGVGNLIYWRWKKPQCTRDRDCPNHHPQLAMFGCSCCAWGMLVTAAGCRVTAFSSSVWQADRRAGCHHCSGSLSRDTFLCRRCVLSSFFFNVNKTRRVKSKHSWLKRVMLRMVTADLSLMNSI